MALVNMASSDSCLIHFDGKKGPLTSFSVVSYQNFLDYRRIWLTLHGEERNVAQRSLQFVTDSMERRKVARSKISNMQISLYIIEVVTDSAFTNSSMIKRAQVHCQNMDKGGVPSYSGIDIIDEETESDEC
jgi:hypothetical protein